MTSRDASQPAWSLRRSLIEHGRALALAVSAVGLVMTVHVQHAAPPPATVPVTSGVAALVVVIVLILPALLLYAADRVLSLRAPHRVARFRAAMFGVAIGWVLVHWLPLEPRDGASGATFEVTAFVVAVVVAAAIVWAAVYASLRWLQLATTFFLLMAVALPVFVVQAVDELTTAAVPVPLAYLDKPEASDEAAHPSIFVLVFDELSYDALLEPGTGAIDAERFPSFAQLARDGVVFTNATSNYYRTRVVLPGFIEPFRPLAGTSGINLYIQDARVATELLPECGVVFACPGVFRDLERRTSSVAAHIALTVAERALPAPFDALGGGALLWGSRLAGQPQSVADPEAVHLFAMSHFERLLEDLDTAAPRGEAYVFHTLLTHFPYIYAPDGTVRAVAQRQFWLPEAEFEATWAHYLDQIAFADAKLGEVLSSLQASGRYDDSIIIVTADHGLRIPGPPEAGRPIEVDGLMTRVPLLVRAPGLAAGRSDVDYQHLDFTATVRDLLGLPVDLADEGVSALDATPRDRAKWFVVHSSSERDSWMYRLDPASGEWRLGDEPANAATH